MTRTLAVVISQSGETADTLAGLREAKDKGAHVLAITNVVGSSVDREADSVLYTYAGPEIAVASTKAYTTQLMVMYLLALHLAEARGTLPAAERRRLIDGLQRLPEQMQRAVAGAGARCANSPGASTACTACSTWGAASISPPRWKAR